MAIVQALTILSEAADRICGKRLKPAIPVFLEAMERHGHLSLGTEIREGVLKASAAVRTFADWNDPPPGFFEMVIPLLCIGPL